MKLNYSRGVGLGTAFGVMFWLTMDSVALGIALGVAMGVAFSASPQGDINKPEDSAERRDTEKKIL